MSIFDGNMPYTNLHELNNNWIVKIVKEVKDKEDLVDEAVISAKESETNAKSSETNAKVSEENALNYYNNIEEYTSTLSQTVQQHTNEIATNSSRIDNLSTLTEGSTTGDAELQDIRVWFNGKTSPNAGDSVRGQVSYVNDKVNGMSEQSKNLLPVNYNTVDVNGLTTVYHDGNLKITGTATANGGRLTKVVPDFILPAGTYYTYASETYLRGIILHNAADNTIITTGINANGTSFTLTADTTVFIGITTQTGDVVDIDTNIQIQNGNSRTPWQEPSYITAVDVVARENTIQGYSTITPTWIDGMVLGSGGVWSANSGYSYTDVALTEGEVLLVYMWVNEYSYPLSVWSGDNKLLKTCTELSATAENKNFVYSAEHEYEIVRINVLRTQKQNVVIRKFTVSDNVNASIINSENNDSDFFKVLFNDVICVGDSLTQGSYNGSDLHADNYPNFLSKLTGWNCENAGRSGWSTLQWWNGDSSSQKGFPYYNYAEYDSAIIFLGTNEGLTDTLETDVDPYASYLDYANTNTGCYCKIIEGMKEQNPNINIFLCSIYVTGNGAPLETTNTVINKIANKYDLPVINLNISEFSIPRTAYHANTNIHLGRLCYAKMANIIKRAMTDDVLKNTTDYNIVPLD